MNRYSKWLMGAAVLILSGSLAYAASDAQTQTAQTVTPPTAPTPSTTNPAMPTNPAAPAGPTSTPTTGPTVPATGPEAAAPATTPLDKVENARRAIVGAKVKDSKGEVVGEVKAVTLGPDGKVASVRVETGARTVMLKSDSLAFAQADKTVVSTQTKDEIQALPPT